MYSDKVTKSRARLWIALALLLLAGLVIALTGAERAEKGENAAAAIRETVESSARQCYVIEGVYPPSLQYLEDNYGLEINTEEYYVVYDVYASNLPPAVKVVGK